MDLDSHARQLVPVKEQKGHKGHVAKRFPAMFVDVFVLLFEEEWKREKPLS